MKRFYILLTLLCVLLCVCAGACAEGGEETGEETQAVILFGQYEQDNNAANGKEPIEWIVLTVQDGKALLLSRQVLDCVSFHEKQADLTWEESSLRAWLNGEFFNSSFVGSMIDCNPKKMKNFQRAIDRDKVPTVRMSFERRCCVYADQRHHRCAWYYKGADQVLQKGRCVCS